MKKAIISILMTLLFLVNMSRGVGVAMSRNNQLNDQSLNTTSKSNNNSSSNNGNDGSITTTNKSSQHFLEETLTSVPLSSSLLIPLQLKNKSIVQDTPIVLVGHQIRSELEQIRHQAKFYFAEIKSSLESFGCRLGMTSFCEDAESNQTGGSTTPANNISSTIAGVDKLPLPETLAPGSNVSEGNSSTPAALLPSSISEVEIGNNTSTNSTLAVDKLPQGSAISPETLPSVSQAMTGSNINESGTHPNVTGELSEPAPSVPENLGTPSLDPSLIPAGNTTVNESVHDVNVTGTTLEPASNNITDSTSNATSLPTTGDASSGTNSTTLEEKPLAVVSSNTADSNNVTVTSTTLPEVVEITPSP